MREITYDTAANEAIHEEFRRNPRTVHLATDLPIELREEFGPDRIRVTPIAENNFVGAALGLAGSGWRTVANIRMATFGFVALGHRHRGTDDHQDDGEHRRDQLLHVFTPVPGTTNSIGTSLDRELSPP